MAFLHTHRVVSRTRQEHFTSNNGPWGCRKRPWPFWICVEERLDPGEQNSVRLQIIGIMGLCKHMYSCLQAWSAHLTVHAPWKSGPTWRSVSGIPSDDILPRSTMRWIQIRPYPPLIPRETYPGSKSFPGFLGVKTWHGSTTSRRCSANSQTYKQTSLPQRVYQHLVYIDKHTIWSSHCPVSYNLI